MPSRSHGNAMSLQRRRMHAPTNTPREHSLSRRSGGCGRRPVNQPRFVVNATVRRQRNLHRDRSIQPARKGRTLLATQLGDMKRDEAEQDHPDDQYEWPPILRTTRTMRRSSLHTAKTTFWDRMRRAVDLKRTANDRHRPRKPEPNLRLQQFVPIHPELLVRPNRRLTT